MAERGYALLGYAAAGATAGVLLATRVREKAVLPGGHTVYAVTDSAWAMVPLQVRGRVRGSLFAGWACCCCCCVRRSCDCGSSAGMQCCTGGTQARLCRVPLSDHVLPLQNEAADAAAAAALAGLPPPRADGDFWRAMQQFTLNNAHYYCETADISRPFPRCVPVKLCKCI